METGFSLVNTGEYIDGDVDGCDEDLGCDENDNYVAKIQFVVSGLISNICVWFWQGFWKEAFAFHKLGRG